MGSCSQQDSRRMRKLLHSLPGKEREYFVRPATFVGPESFQATLIASVSRWSKRKVERALKQSAVRPELWLPSTRASSLEVEGQASNRVCECLLGTKLSAIPWIKSVDIEGLIKEIREIGLTLSISQPVFFSNVERTIFRETRATAANTPRLFFPPNCLTERKA